MEEIWERIERNIIKEAKQDALRLTKFYLEGFRSQEQYVKNLAEDIDDRYQSSVTPQYGEHIGHSSVPKMELGAKLAVNSLHQQQKADYVIAKHLADRIGLAVNDLPLAEKMIMLCRYINKDKEPWNNIAEGLSYDVSSCYRLHNQGLRSVAIHLFGISDVLEAEERKRNRAI